MELGQRIRQARLEANLSQRQLCGGEITRNMLSLIENGSAQPSMATLRYLAERLGKPISFFLEEQTVTSPNQTLMAQARRAYGAGDTGEALRLLGDFRSPDPVFDAERNLLRGLCLLAAAEQAIREQRLPYAVSLLEQAEPGLYWVPALERERLLLLGLAQPEQAVSRLPADDRELLIRASAALKQGDPARSGQILDAAVDKTAPDWNWLRGEAWLALGDYSSAAGCYHLAEKAFPRQTAPRLERCYREMGDYKMAYEYACRQREQENP